MKVQPRHQLLQIWRGVVAESFDGGQWQWGGRDGRNSISDAEQLLCILAPATSVASFGLDEPDSTSDDVAAALSGLGTRVDIPVKLLRAVDEYLTAYTEPDGTPIFSGEGYFSPPTPRNGTGPGKLTPELRARQVVDSYVMSINLSLATIGFVRQFRRSILRDQALLEEISRTEQLASRRLTAAMVALLRSFTIWVFEPDSSDGRSLTETINQTGLPDEQVQRQFRTELADVRAGLRDLTIGIAPKVEADLLRPNKMFECGWSWSVVREAPKIPTGDDVGRQDDGHAEEGAYIYFTVVALDGIDELFSDRTQLLSLLTDEQLLLARALQVRSNLTRKYWSKIATFGRDRWPLQAIPWQRTNANRSDYFSLLVTAIVIRDLVERRVDEKELDRVSRVLELLASRARITLPTYPGDLAPTLHAPGDIIDLNVDPAGESPELAWVMSDFAPLLMRRAVSLAGLLRNAELRARMLDLSDQVWAHLESRRMERNRGFIWDQPQRVFPAMATVHQRPSWYFTKRVVDSLITSAEVISSEPLRSETATRLAEELLAEATHLYDQELLRGPVDPGPSTRDRLQLLAGQLNRARESVATHPGTASALANRILLDLHELAFARADPDGQL